MSEEDYYKILSVEPTATHDEVLEAAKRLSEVWGAKRKHGGLSPEKQTQIHNQIRKATSVLTSPLRRLDYDLKRGIRKHIACQARLKRKYNFIPVRASESSESLPTIKIPGQLDYEKLRRSIAAIEDRAPAEMGLEVPPHSRLNLNSGNAMSKRHSFAAKVPQNVLDRFQKNTYPERTASATVNLQDYSPKSNVSKENESVLASSHPVEDGTLGVQKTNLEKLTENGAKSFSLKNDTVELETREQNADETKHDPSSPVTDKTEHKENLSNLSSNYRLHALLNEIMDSVTNVHSKMGYSDQDTDSIKSQFFRTQSEASEQLDNTLESNSHTLNTPPDSSKDLNLEKSKKENEYSNENSAENRQDLLSSRLALERKVQSGSDIVEPKASIVDTRKIASERDLRKEDSDAKLASAENQERESENELDSRVKGFEIKYIDSFKLMKDKFAQKQRSPSQTLSADREAFKPTRLPLKEKGSRISKDLSKSSNQDFKESLKRLQSNSFSSGTRSKRFQNAVELLQDVAIFPSIEETSAKRDIAPKEALSEHLVQSISKQASEKIVGQVKSLIDNFKEWISEADSNLKHHRSESEMLLEPGKGNQEKSVTDADDLPQCKSDTGLTSRKDEDLKRAFESDLETPGDHDDESVYSDVTGRRKLSKVEKTIIVNDWRDYWYGAGAEAMNETDPLPTQSVSATTRISGSDIRTEYTFGPDTEIIAVFVNGEMRARIVKDQKHDVYSNDMPLPSEDSPTWGPDICASTVIAANDCFVTTEVTRRGLRESIAVYKNDALLCRTGNMMTVK